MVQDAVPDLPGQVQASAVPFQLIHHAKALLVVPEGATEEGRERLLAQVPERGMPQIVAQRDGLGQILVQPQGPGGRPGDLGHLERMGEPDSVVVALRRDEDLGLVLEAAEGLRVNDAVAIQLESGPEGIGLLFSLSALGLRGKHRSVREDLPLELFGALSRIQPEKTHVDLRVASGSDGSF